MVLCQSALLGAVAMLALIGLTTATQLALATGQPAASPIQNATRRGASSPIRKVVALLEEIKAQVRKEGEQNEQAHEKYQCWCETNGRMKIEATQAAGEKVEQLEATMEEAAANLGSLKAEIGVLGESMAEDSAAVETAQALRNRESEEFQAREAEMKETRDLLKVAISALSQVQLVQQAGSQHVEDVAKLHSEAEAALVQVHKSVLRRYPQYHSVMQKDLFDLIGSFNSYARDKAADELEEDGFLSRQSGEAFRRHGLLPWEKRRKASALQKGPPSAGGAAAGANSYDPRSRRVLGLLGEMHDEVARDLADSQQAEKQAAEEFKQLHAAKLSEVAAAKEQKGRKQAAFASLRHEAAEAKEDLGLTKEALQGDTSFLANMKASCKAEEQQHATASKALQEEIIALGETVKILTEDDARELFDKTFSFVQLGASRSGAGAAVVASSKAHSQAQLEERLTSRAMKRIAQAARKHKDWALASLAVHVRLDTFGELKAAMDKMSNELQKQQREESAKRDLCTKDIDRAEDSVKEAELENHDLAEKRARLASSVETLTSEVEELRKEEQEMEVSLKQASEQRKAESQLFQSSVMDQRATVNILQKAVARLEKYYSFTQTGEHSQEHGEASRQPVAPPKPQAYEKSGGAGGAVELLRLIIQKASEEEQDLEASEKHAQVAYATLVADTKVSVDSNRAAQREKVTLKVSAEAEKSETEEALTASGVDLAKTGDLLKAHHLDCDFLLEFFKVRQDARADEIDAIADATAILAGAKFDK